MKDCNIAGQVYQLGGWTGRSSFKVAYSGSQLTEIWFNQSYTEGVILGSDAEDGEIQAIPNSVNVLWIANPQGLPTEADLNVIKNWLHATPENLAGTEISKKIVITFGTNIEIASNVISICESLGLNTKPRRSENPNDFNGFFLKSAHGIDGSIYQQNRVYIPWFSQYH